MVEKNHGISEDWLSLWLGLFIFLLSLGVFWGLDLLGWGWKVSVWTDLTKAMGTVSKEVKGITGLTALFITYLFLMFIMGIGARALKVDQSKFQVAFTLVFFISMVCWILGHYAYVAATPDQLAKLGIGWSLNLTGEAGYILALIVGLIVGNFFPGFSETLKEATRPELYIKTAIVIMGAGLGVKAAEALGWLPPSCSGVVCHCGGLPDLLGGRLLCVPQVFQVQ
jgi:hypothetical protein